MMPEYIAVQCYACEMFQALQQNKAAKFKVRWRFVVVASRVVVTERRWGIQPDTCRASQKVC